MRDRADAQFANDAVGGTAPRLPTSRTLERVLAIEIGPIAALDRDLVDTGGEGLAVVFLVFSQYDGLCSVEV